MNSVPTNQQISDALGITVNEVKTYIVKSHALAIQGGWTLTFSANTPDNILERLQLTKTLTCTIVLPQQERPLWRS